MNDNKLVEVCDSCLQASCWYGEFMCDNAKGAGTCLKTVKELKEKALENHEYWSDQKMIEVFGDPCPHGYAKTKTGEK